MAQFTQNVANRYYGQGIGLVEKRQLLSRAVHLRFTWKSARPGETRPLPLADNPASENVNYRVIAARYGNRD